MTIPCPSCDLYEDPCPECGGEGRIDVRMSPETAKWHARMDDPDFAASEWGRLRARMQMVATGSKAAA